MANLKVGTGLTFDGGTGNVTVTGIITAIGQGNIGVNTTNVNASSLTGVGKSFHGIYIDDGFIAFKNKLDNSEHYAITKGKFSIGKPSRVRVISTNVLKFLECSFAICSASI